jgi:threonine synthase
LTIFENIADAAGKGVARACELNHTLVANQCIRCETRLELADYFTGCPLCLSNGYPSSVRQLYSASAWRLRNSQRRGMARYASYLPYSIFPSLGEGGTPLLAEPMLADELGIAALFIKNEGQNPTGSHKDRMSALAIARALDVGASTVIAASSGNAGASIAAYSAHVRLQCEIVTTSDMNPMWRRAIRMAGARLVAAESPLYRWKYVEKRVAEFGWFPVTNYLTPPVGSNHFGIDGLKTIAFEIFEDTRQSEIDAIIVPTSRADLLWGVFEGYRLLQQLGALDRMPRLYAVEPFPRIEAVLRGSDHRTGFDGRTQQVSIAGSTVTYQAIDAITKSNGGVVVASDEDAAESQLALARCGLYVELSSAASLSGLRRLKREGQIKPGERVVLIATSSGYKELEFDEEPILTIDKEPDNSIG